MPRLLLLALTLALLSPVRLHSADAAPAKASKTVRLLTIGNSFSGNATQYLGAIAKAGGHTLIHREASSGGFTMQQHWEKHEAAERNPSDPKGQYPTKKTLRQSLTLEPWDYVTIQQASIRSHDPASYHPYAKELCDLVHQLAPKAEILLHETWEYRVDDPRFAKTDFPAGEPRTQDEMYQMLSKAYDTVGKELGLRIIPVGDAFHAVNHDPAWHFNPDRTFDPKSAKAPALPDQTHSLNRGWNWKTEKDKTTLVMDGHHASPLGCYLAACVWYEVLFNESVAGNSYLPTGIKPEEAKYLQERAHEAVERRAK